MLFLRNTSNQGKKIINRFGKGIFSKATNSQFNFKKNYPNISINFNNSVFSRKFSTGNQINEKESIDLVESIGAYPRLSEYMLSSQQKS